MTQTPTDATTTIQKRVARALDVAGWHEAGDYMRNGWMRGIVQEEIERLTAERDAAIDEAVAGAYEAAISDVMMFGDLFSQRGDIQNEAITNDIRALTPADATAALAARDERVRQGAWAEAMAHLDKPLDDVPSRRMADAATFAAEAYERAGRGDEGTYALRRAFITAMADFMHPDLDYLRADPEAAAANRKGDA
ncbi:hypothetical protein [Thioclava kandeliae]|uniref:Uncharacterized protein n=1 Tax=Thioclava kandeliae TaxID=3070818 RepID=A0ABV1SFF8_9RHOB